MKKIAIFCISGFALSQAAAHACDAPTTPVMNDNGESYTVDTFSDLTQNLNTFDVDLANYRTCLDEIISAPTEHAAADWSGALSAYNATSELQADVYTRYEKIEKDFQTSQHKRAIDAAQEARTQSVEASQKELAAQLTRSAS